MMKAFMERLIFPYVVYDANLSSLLKTIPSGFIYEFVRCLDETNGI